MKVPRIITWKNSVSCVDYFQMKKINFDLCTMFVFVFCEILWLKTNNVIKKKSSGLFFIHQFELYFIDRKFILKKSSKVLKAITWDIQLQKWFIATNYIYVANFKTFRRRNAQKSSTTSQNTRMQVSVIDWKIYTRRFQIKRHKT